MKNEKRRYRKIKLVSILYEVGQIIKGIYNRIVHGETFYTTGAGRCKRDLEKEYPDAVVQVRKLEREYLLDVVRAIELGALIPVDEAQGINPEDIDD